MHTRSIALRLLHAMGRVALLLAGCLFSLGMSTSQAYEPNMDALGTAYEGEIRPLMRQYCHECHSAELSEAEISFVLASGGHNAGIISEPGHANRSYRIGTREAHGPWIDPADWEHGAAQHEGSWWPAWQQWLAAHSSKKRAPVALPRGASLGAAPGDYVLTCYED